MINSIAIFLASYLYMAIILIAFITVVFANPSAKNIILKLALLTLPLAFITANVLRRLFYNPRPFVTDHIEPLIPHAANNGFPSDHTLLVISIASILFVYNKRLGVFLFILGLLVGFSRVYAKVHNSIDIVGGIFIAIVATYSAFIILRIIKLHLMRKKGKHEN